MGSMTTHDTALPVPAIVTYDDPVCRAIDGLAHLRGWTLKQLAEAAGVNYVSLKHKLNGNLNRRIMAGDIEKLAAALGVDPIDLARGSIHVRLTADGMRSVTGGYATPNLAAS
jgi:DNA-binding Xre family transcriptional regulator